MSEILENLPFAEYRKLDGVNQSSFSLLDPERGGCPAIWKHAQDNPPEESDTAAMAFGRAFHSFALTPDLFDQEYVLEDEAMHQKIIDRETTKIADAHATKAKWLANGGKVKDLPKGVNALATKKPPTTINHQMSAWKDYVAELAADGVTVISPKMLRQVEAMHRSAVSVPDVYALYQSGGRAELSLQAELDDGTGRGVLCKARLDFLSSDDRVINDYKSVQSAAPIDLGRFVWKYRSHIQAAFYLDLAKVCGIPAEVFSWTFIDKRAPHPCVYYEAEPELIQLGRAGYQQFLQAINDARTSGHWPGHYPALEFPGLLTDLMEAVC